MDDVSASMRRCGILVVDVSCGRVGRELAGDEADEGEDAASVAVGGRNGKDEAGVDGLDNLRGDFARTGMVEGPAPAEPDEDV